MLPPEWLASLLSSIAILAAILGWFIVDQLDRRRARREHAYYVKAERYMSIISSLHRLALVVGVWETVRTVDAGNPKHAKANFLKLSAAATMIPDDEAMDRLQEILDNETGDDDEPLDPTQAAREEPTEEAQAIETLEGLRSAIDEVAALAFIREGHQLREAIGALTLFKVSPDVQKHVQAVAALMSERPMQAGLMQIAEMVDLAGLVEMGDFEEWRKRASAELEAAVNALRLDLESTI